MASRLQELGVGGRVLDAFRAVPRHELVPQFWELSNGPPSEHRTPVEHNLAEGDLDALALLHDVDRAVAVKQPGPSGTTSSASAPRLLAAQAEELALAPGMSVLEIGTGPGYFAAILAELTRPGGRVVSVEIDTEVAASASARLVDCGYGDVTVLEADGDDGAPDQAPFDRVVVSVGCTDVASAWLDQIVPDGFALVPLLHGAAHPILAVRRDGVGRVTMRSGYVPIQGRQASSVLWPHARAGVEVTERQPLPARLGHLRAVRPEDIVPFGARHWQLGFWVAISDERAGFLAALNDGAGSSARVDPEHGDVSWGGPQGRNLARDLLGHAERWADLGAPPLDAFVHTFVQRPHAMTDDFLVRRLHHDQLIRLVRG